MTMTHYSDYAILFNSSAIDELYYDEPSRNLVIVFNGGNLAAYEDVSPEVFRTFKLQDDSENGSAGRYYNDLKPFLTGVSAPDLDELTFRDDEEDEPLVDDETDVEPEYVTPDLDEDDFTPVAVSNRYTIAFEHVTETETEVVTYEVELDVFAPNPDAALNRFGSAVGTLGYGRLTVKSLTRHFD